MLRTASVKGNRYPKFRYPKFKGRCPGLCLSLTIKSSEDGSLNSVEFQEDAISKIISIKTTEKGVSSSIGTCEKNEVE